MNFVRSHRLMLFVSLATILVVVVLTVTITWATGISFEGSQPEPAQGHSSDQETDAPQLWAEEPEWSLKSEVVEQRSFNFCIDTFALAESSEPKLRRDRAKDAVNEAIGSLREHSFWGLANLDGALSAVYVEGCPDPPLPSMTGEEWINGEFYGSAQKYAKETMSDYFFHVFVMPLGEIDALLGGTSTRVTGQEIQCVGHVCGPESFGIYLTPEEVSGDSPFVRSVMEYALGFK